MCANKGKFCNYFAESLRSLFDVSSLSGVLSAFSGGQYAAKLYSTRPSIKVPDSSFFDNSPFKSECVIACSQSQCLEIIENVSFQFFDFGIFHQFLKKMNQEL